MSLPPYVPAPGAPSRQAHRDERRRRARRVSRILRTVALVVAVGVAGLLAHGANRPADPYLEPISGEAGGRSPLAGFGEVAFRITDGSGTVAEWCALLAETVAARNQGLMEQQDLRGYDGMVFRFDEPTTGGFYMRNTRIPLSIAFFDEQGALVGTADMAPCPDDVEDCPTYAPDEPYVHALEVPLGGLDDLGVEPGATLSFPGGGCGTDEET